jgi:hypothetical protein
MIRDGIPMALAAAALAVALERPRTAPVVAPVAPPPPVMAPWPPVAPLPVAAPPRPGPIRRALAAVIDGADAFLPYR